MVLMLSHVLYHDNDKVMARLSSQVKRKPMTPLTVTTLLGTGAPKPALVAPSMVLQQQKYQELRQLMDVKLAKCAKTTNGCKLS